MLKNKFFAATLTTLLASSALAAGTIAPANADEPKTSFPFTNDLTLGEVFPGQKVDPLAVVLRGGLYKKEVEIWSSLTDSYVGLVASLEVTNNPLFQNILLQANALDPKSLPATNEAVSGMDNTIEKFALKPETNLAWDDIKTLDLIVTAKINKELATTGGSVPTDDDWTKLQGVGEIQTAPVAVTVKSSLAGMESLDRKVNSGESIAFTAADATIENSVLSLAGQTEDFSIDGMNLKVANTVTAGTHTVSLDHKYTIDEENVTVTYNLNVEVTNANPVFSEPNLPKTVPTASYEGQIAAEPKTNFSLNGRNTLPKGLNLDTTTGAITGTVAPDVKVGEHKFSVTATNNSVSETKEFSITVEPIITNTFGSFDISEDDFVSTLNINGLLVNAGDIESISVEGENVEGFKIEKKGDNPPFTWVLKAQRKTAAKIDFTLYIDFADKTVVSQNASVSFVDRTEAPTFDVANEDGIVVLSNPTIEENGTATFTVPVHSASKLVETAETTVLEDLGFKINSAEPFQPFATEGDTEPIKESNLVWNIAGPAQGEGFESDIFEIQATALAGDKTSNQDFQIVFANNHTGGGDNTGGGNNAGNANLPITGTAVWMTIVAALLALTAGTATMLMKRKNVATKH